MGYNSSIFWQFAQKSEVADLELTFTPLPADGEKRLYIFLREQGVSSSCIKDVKYHAGGFFAGDRAVHTDYRVRPGEVIRFSLPPEPPTAVAPEDLPLTIAWEDDFVLALDKPAGLAVHPTLNYPGGTLANAWMGELARRGEAGVFRPVNRIDKDTSGLVLCAKNAFAAPILAESAQKRYYAIVQGELPPGPGVVDAPIGRRGESIIGRCVCPEGKPSRTEYTVLASAGGHSLVECRPVTGRTHQIRVHFAWLGHPLAGDDLYGGSREKIGRHALHCGLVRFCHPRTGQEICVKSPFPEDISALLAELGMAAREVTAL